MKRYAFSGLSRREIRWAVKRADSAIFEDILQFLEDDPREFGAGYLMEMFWKYITKYPLSDIDVARLERAALHRLERPMTRDFMAMCKRMCHTATPGFWQAVEAATASENPVVRVTASCLLPYAKGIEAGKAYRLRDWPMRHMYLAGYDYRFDESGLIALIAESDNWIGGVLVRREPIPEDLPVVFYYRSDQTLPFATLDMSFCIPDVVIPKLASILDVQRHKANIALYAIYLLHKINDPRAVPVLIEFYRHRMDHKFSSPSKGNLQVAIFKTLNHYATVDALEFMENFRPEDEYFRRYRSDDRYGWLGTYP